VIDIHLKSQRLLILLIKS